MNIAITPSIATGSVAAPPSKSMSHRLLIAAGLAKGTSLVEGLAFSQDILATIDCLRALGAQVTVQGSTVTVTGIDPANSTGETPLSCRESGSTLRFFIPLCLLSAHKHTFTGYGRLMERPQTVYKTLCDEHGLLFAQDENTITVSGVLQGGNYTLAGNISSQFITGLLYALPLTECDSTITLIPPVESRSYIDLTLSALHDFGIDAGWKTPTTLWVNAGQYQPRQITVEGDYSNAAFLDGLNMLGGQVTVTGLQPNSLQGDKVYQRAFQTLCEDRPVISLADCPDLGPILMALAAAKNGATFTHTARLKIKESDRGAAMASELAKFGVQTRIDDNQIVVFKSQLTAPTSPLDGHNDHRIVMALATLCTKTGGVIHGAQAVTKSYPDYFDTIRSIGIQWKEV